MPNSPDMKEPARKPAPTIPPLKQIIAEGNAEITRRAHIIVAKTISTGTYPEPSQLRLLGEDGTIYVFKLLKKQVRQQVSRAASTAVKASPQVNGPANPKVKGNLQIAASKASPPPKQAPSSKPNITAGQSNSTKQAQPKKSPPPKSGSGRDGRKAITTTHDWIEKQNPRRSGRWIAVRGFLLAIILVSCAVFVARWMHKLAPFNA
jgi:hypothetical protein